MAQRTEKTLDQALNRAFQMPTRFPQLVLQQDEVWQRSQLSLVPSRPWGKVSLEVRNPTTGALEVIEREGETDVLVVATIGPGRRVALQLENKLGSGKFKQFQSEADIGGAPTSRLRAGGVCQRPRRAGACVWSTYQGKYALHTMPCAFRNW